MCYLIDIVMKATNIEYYVNLTYSKNGVKKCIFHTDRRVYALSL